MPQNIPTKYTNGRGHTQQTEEDATSLKPSPIRQDTLNGIENHSSTPTQSVCYGRLKDLEMMVPAQWWKTVFADSMYLKTDGDVIEDPEITNEEIALLESDKRIHSLLLNGVDKSLERGFFIFLKL